MNSVAFSHAARCQNQLGVAFLASLTVDAFAARAWRRHAIFFPSSAVAGHGGPSNLSRNKRHSLSGPCDE